MKFSELVADDMGKCFRGTVCHPIYLQTRLTLLVYSCADGQLIDKFPIFNVTGIRGLLLDALKKSSAHEAFR